MISARYLLIIARIWLILGCLSLIMASTRLFHRALAAGLTPSHLYWIVPVAIAAGALKAIVVMRKRMRANIRRLATTAGKLWVWQVYPPVLLIFIIAMVVLMIVLKRVFALSGPGLGFLGGVDLAVGIALGVASLEYRHATPQSPTLNEEVQS